MPFGRGAVVSLGLAVILGGGACTDTCTADVACGTQVIVDMSSLTAPIATLVADSPCSFSFTNSGEVVVSKDPPIGNPTGSCQIHATLTDGSTWVAVMSWAPDTSACCNGSSRNVGPPPMFTRDNSDGGM